MLLVQPEEFQVGIVTLEVTSMDQTTTVYPLDFTRTLTSTSPVHMAHTQVIIEPQPNSLVLIGRTSMMSRHQVDTVPAIQTWIWDTITPRIMPSTTVNSILLKDSKVLTTFVRLPLRPTTCHLDKVLE